MVAFARAVCAAVLFLLSSVPAAAADKAFKRNDLADAAIKLEARIKAEAGEVTRPLAALRREADDAFQRGDFGGGLQVLGQIVVAAPLPSTAVFFSAPPLQNPTQRPSGEKNGSDAPSVPGIAVAAS